MTFLIITDRQGKIRLLMVWKEAHAQPSPPYIWAVYLACSRKRDGFIKAKLECWLGYKITYHQLWP